MKTVCQLDSNQWMELRALEEVSGPELLSQLVAEYTRDSAMAITKLSSAFRDNDFKAVGAVAHSLKSSSASLGATELARLLAELERATKQPLEANLWGQTLAPLIAQIIEGLPSVIEALKMELAKTAA